MGRDHKWADMVGGGRPDISSIFFVIFLLLFCMLFLPILSLKLGFCRPIMSPGCSNRVPWILFGNKSMSVAAALSVEYGVNNLGIIHGALGCNTH